MPVHHFCASSAPPPSISPKANSRRGETIHVWAGRRFRPVNRRWLKLAVTLDKWHDREVELASEWFLLCCGLPTATPTWVSTPASTGSQEGAYPMTDGTDYISSTGLPTCPSCWWSSPASIIWELVSSRWSLLTIILLHRSSSQSMSVTTSQAYF